MPDNNENLNRVRRAVEEIRIDTSNLWDDFTTRSTQIDTAIRDAMEEPVEAPVVEPTVYTNGYLLSLFEPGSLDRFTNAERRAVFNILRSSGRYRYVRPSGGLATARIPNFDSRNIEPTQAVESSNPTDSYLRSLLPTGDIDRLNNATVSSIISSLRRLGVAYYNVTADNGNRITRAITDPNFVSPTSEPTPPPMSGRGARFASVGTLPGNNPTTSFFDEDPYKKTSKNEKRVFMNFEFREGQEVICTDVSGYDGKYISQGLKLIVANVGNNVLGFESIKTEEGKIIKFMKYRFTPVEHLNTLCNLRDTGKYRYGGSNAKITGAIDMKTFVVPIGTGSSFQKAREVYVWQLKVIDPGFIRKDVLSVKPFEAIGKFKEGSYYYMGDSEWDASRIENLYLEDKKLVIKSVDKSFITFKGLKGKYPKQMFTIFKMAKAPLELAKGVNVLIKEKGVEEGVYTVIDLKKTSSLTLVGIMVNSSLIYVSGKNCKILEEKNAESKQKV